jgi:hypothetical protein
MKIIVVDGKSGKTGALFIEELRKRGCDLELTAIGTNVIATTSMLKAGANDGASGENAIMVATRGADLIVGPLGIVEADAIMGEITPKAATAIGSSQATKLLIPINLCNTIVVGTQDFSMKKLIEESVNQFLELVSQ